MKINISIEEESRSVDELIEKIFKTINDLGGVGSGAVATDDWIKGWDQAIEACYVEVGEVIDKWRKNKWRH